MSLVMDALARISPKPAPNLTDMVPLLTELGDLKRVRTAVVRGSFAECLFRETWGALLARVPLRDVALSMTARALAAARLGFLDMTHLRLAGLFQKEALDIMERGLEAVSGCLDQDLNHDLKTALRLSVSEQADNPPFVQALCEQPRAGVTCPGKPRILFEPPENHAEHCLMVAVYGVILSPVYEAEPETVFLAALSHHLHNALMPDSGFTGEMLLEPHLAHMMTHCTDKALQQIEPTLRADIIEARLHLDGTGTPEGRAFHAADVLDRVLQIRQHLQPGQISMENVLEDWELVHDGLVKSFHDNVLSQAGLA